MREPAAFVVEREALNGTLSHQAYSCYFGPNLPALWPIVWAFSTRAPLCLWGLSS